MARATAVANPNIAFIKYWGRADAALNLPANPSLSMNLAALTTVTTVEFHAGSVADSVTIDGDPATGQALDRVVAHRDRVRAHAGIDLRARVASRNDFPAGTGLASSASAFAALSLAASVAAGLDLNEFDLSRLARLASGSACRSVPAGFCLWSGDDDASSYARQVAPPRYWELHDVVAIVSRAHKQVGSHDGHGLAPGSSYHACRVAAVPALLDRALHAIKACDLAELGEATEADALAMHGVMMTSSPSLLYWMPGTIAVLHAVRAWRAEGLQVYFTLDAGPNVHCLCEASDAAEVEARLAQLPGVVEVIDSVPGGGARLVDYHLF